MYPFNSFLLLYQYINIRIKRDTENFIKINILQNEKDSFHCSSSLGCMRCSWRYLLNPNPLGRWWPRFFWGWSRQGSCYYPSCWVSRVWRCFRYTLQIKPYFHVFKQPYPHRIMILTIPNSPQYVWRYFRGKYQRIRYQSIPNRRWTRNGWCYD